MQKYNRDYHIDYMFVNEDLTAAFINLAAKVQETSLLHSYHSGQPMEWFLENKRAFVLTGYIFKVYSYPKWGDNINIATWPSKFRGFIGKRSFQGKDQAGNVFIEVDSDWIYLNMDTKKPERIPPDMADKYGQTYPALFDEKVKIPDESEYEKLGVSSHKVCRYDIDSNHHVNNIMYIAWAINSVDNDLYMNNIITSANVKYNKESRLDEELVIEMYKNGKNRLALIKGAEGDLRCSVHMEFSEKNY